MIINTKYKSTCNTCKSILKRGTEVNWDRSTKTVDCMSCFHEQASNDIDIDVLHEEQAQVWTEQDSGGNFNYYNNQW